MSDADLCASLQDDELVVLESIYPGCAEDLGHSSGREGARHISMEIAIALPTPLATHLVHAADHARVDAADNPAAGPSASSATVPLELSYLPALRVKLALPADYPLRSPPKPLGVRAPLQGADALGVGWLSRSHLRTVQDKLAELWREEANQAGEGSGVLWRWWEWIAQGEFLADLQLLDSAGDLSLPIPPMISSSTFHTALKSQNAAQLHSSFERTAFSCTICFENRKGKSCIQMPGCGCVFCTPCLNACWGLAITEGTLENVSCPSPDCVKRRSARDSQKGDKANGLGMLPEEMDPGLVESVVGKDLRDRWESLKDRRMAEIDPTYTLCPRPTCQAAVPAPEKTAEDRWDRYRQCPKCNFSFCLSCSSTWHGPHTACPLSATDAILSAYLRFPEGSEGRRRIEMQRGKANIEKMLAKWKEDEDNKAWIMSRTSACTGCGVRVEKSHGCNHMTCQRCQAHFCYRCGSSISKEDPYKHFNTPGRSCFQKLFDTEELDRAERETAMAQAGIDVERWEFADEWREVRGFWEW